MRVDSGQLSQGDYAIRDGKLFAIPPDSEGEIPLKGFIEHSDGTVSLETPLRIIGLGTYALERGTWSKQTSERLE